MKRQLRVVIESPYAGDVETNVIYARRAMHFALLAGAAPFASHLLYTQCLNDNDPDERELGIAAGLSFVADCDETWVFTDYGISEGMRRGMKAAVAAGRPIRKLSIGRNP